jgi:hypothetical protein
MIDNSKEYIICAAMYYVDGTANGIWYENIPHDKGHIICCLNHEFRTLASIYPDKKHFGEEVIQGFMTSKRRFIGREEALQLAWDCGQIEEIDFGKTLLYSEDLY